MSTNIDDMFAALADPTRRHVVELLRTRPRSAGELAEASGASPSMMSRHLRILADHGLVDDERGAHDARVRVFRLRREPFTALQTWIDETQAFWNEQLGAFKAHADSRRGRKRS